MPTKPKPVTIEGVTYPSQNAAARAYGVSESSIRKRIKKNDLQRIGKRYTVSICSDDGRVFPSARYAAFALSVSYQYIMFCLKNDRPCKRIRIRRMTELDKILAEIEKRNREPYQFSRR